jgi:hypothetical protein
MLIGFYPRGRGAFGRRPIRVPTCYLFYLGRVRLPVVAGRGVFGGGCRLGISLAAVAGSSFASAERMRSSHGAWGNLSPSMTRRIAAVTAVCCSSVKSVIGMLEPDVTSASRHA